MLNTRWLLRISFLLIVVVALLSLNVTSKSIQASSPSIPLNTPLKYRIAYLLADNLTTVDPLLRSSQLEANLGVLTAHNTKELLALDKAASLHAVIIHNSALSMIDKNWLINAYQSGVVIAMFNVNGPQLADLLNASCIANDGFATEAYSGPHYTIVSRLYLGSPGDVDRLKKAQDFCGKKQVTGITSLASEQFARASGNIDNASDYDTFSHVLISYVQGIEEARQEFEAATNQAPNK